MVNFIQRGSIAGPNDSDKGQRIVAFYNLYRTNPDYFIYIPHLLFFINMKFIKSALVGKSLKNCPFSILLFCSAFIFLLVVKKTMLSEVECGH